MTNERFEMPQLRKRADRARCPTTSEGTVTDRVDKAYRGLQRPSEGAADQDEVLLDPALLPLVDLPQIALLADLLERTEVRRAIRVPTNAAKKQELRFKTVRQSGHS